MDLENLNFKAKDVIQFSVYIISLTIFFISMSAKVDNLNNSFEEFKFDKKEASGENKAEKFITQNDIKALTIRAELNRQNIEIIQKDIELLKMQYRDKNN